MKHYSFKNAVAIFNEDFESARPFLKVVILFRFPELDKMAIESWVFKQ